MTSEKKPSGRQVPAQKKNLVQDLSEKINKSRTFLIASVKNLPSSQFQKIKKQLRGKADIMVVKKSLVLRALGLVEKGALQNIKEKVGADVALFFSELDAFELSVLLSESESPARAKPGDVAPEDVRIEPGPTSLMPGPAISELSGVGLKVAVEGGKIAIKQGATIVKKGEKIKSNVASVMAKLDVMPMRVGFEPIAAYDSKSDATYFDIKIEKKAVLENLREAIGKAFGFAVNVEYVSKETIGWFIARAGREEKILSAKVGAVVEEEKGESANEKSDNGKELSGGEGEEEIGKKSSEEGDVQKNDKEEA